MNTKMLLSASVAAAPLLLASAGAMALDVKLTAIELLGKNVFFDGALSRPSGRQACASCHDPAKGWILPNSAINETTVVAPGARKRRLGSIKTPANAYASFSPPFQPAANPPGVPPQALPPWRGGSFWDGRAEGCGATAAEPGCPVGRGGVSETVRWRDLPIAYQNTSPSGYVRFLGPLADQALNPFPNDVEQNIQERKVCREVKNGRYADLYLKAFGEEINCKNRPDGNGNPFYQTSFRRLAVALSAWQSSADVNSFSSPRDDVVRGKRSFTQLERQGRAIFYGATTPDNPSGKNALCTACHNGVPAGQAPDPAGIALAQLYTDSRYHNIGIPFNREIPDVPAGEKKGLSVHVNDSIVQPGFFKTPTMRNVGKGASGSFTKAYGHNGYFKSLKQITHFYNTRDTKRACADASAKVEEAISDQCWPAAEFPGFMVGAGTGGGPGDIIGNLGLSGAEEDAVVAYLYTLSDTHTPGKP